MKYFLRFGHSDSHAAYSLKVFEKKHDDLPFASLDKEYLISYLDEKTVFFLFEDLNTVLRKEMTLWQRLKWALFGVRR